MKLRVCLAGATGWVGKPLAEAIMASPDLELVAAVARSAAGQRFDGVTISGSVDEALRVPSDVFVDYTSAGAVKGNVMRAIAAGRHVVIGSSGLDDADFAEIDRVAREKRVGVVAVGNFAISGRAPPAIREGSGPTHAELGDHRLRARFEGRCTERHVA